jgi:antitoxin (DNA-binding transcriptional repressor) of toxin-antitoxin stability system
MDISVTDFKAHCLDLIRKVEAGATVTIKRHGKTVARLEAAGSSDSDRKPWERLRGLGGKVFAETDESVLNEKDFGALR